MSLFGAVADLLDPPPRDVFGLLGYTPDPSQQLFHDATEFDVGYGGLAGAGKANRCPDRANPLYNEDMEGKVLTPKGFKLIGDVQVGEQVCNPDGTVACILAIHDRGMQPFYRVTMADGSSVETSADHLWPVSLSGRRVRVKKELPTVPGGLRPEDEWNLRLTQRCRIITTEQLRDYVISAGSADRPYHPLVPLTAPVNMTGAPGRWPFLPSYTLGVLLGDGSVSPRDVSFVSADPEIAEYVNQELKEPLSVKFRQQQEGCISYRISGPVGIKDGSPQDLLRRDGLLGHRSWEKFIPKRFMTAPVAERFAIVQGLMDTDGGIEQDGGSVEYTSVSQQLALDMQYLLRSLGYKATMNTKQTHYLLDGERMPGRLAYRLHIRGPYMEKLFRLQRKIRLVQPFNGGDVWPAHRVVSVEPSGTDNARCITVSHPNGLYVTDDFIVTHNSHALLLDAIRAAATYPGMSLGIFRKTYPELYGSIIVKVLYMQEALKEHFDAVWLASVNELRFSNRSIIQFRHAASMADVTMQQGAEYQWLGLDERQLVTPDIPDFLTTRIRSGRGGVPVIGIRSTFNPGDVGHSDLKERYIEKTDMGNHTYQKMTDEDVPQPTGLFVRFVPGKRSTHIDAAYWKSIQTIEDPVRRRQLAEGDWDAGSGLMFSETWRRSIHVVTPEQFPISEGATVVRARGIDYGITAPFCCLWGAKLSDNLVIVYRELYERGLTPVQQAQLILENEEEHEKRLPLVGYLDPSCWTGYANEPHKSTASEYSSRGVRVMKAFNDRIGGVRLVHEGLRIREDGRPRLLIYDTCPNIIKQLGGIPRSKTNPEDVNTHGDDHAFDALKYLLFGLHGRGLQSLPGATRQKPWRPDSSNAMRVAL
jgi:hypothetical protein